MQENLILSLVIWIADYMQFLSEHRLNGSQIFGLFGFLKTEYHEILGFPHTPIPVKSGPSEFRKEN